MEKLFISITVSRLGLAYGLATSVNGPFRWSAAWLIAVILADVPNGILARRFGADTARRRIADSVVDRITIGAACMATAFNRPEVAIALLPIAVRAAIVVTASIACFMMKNTIVTGGQTHKLGSLSLGLLGFLILARVPYWQVVAVPVAAVSWLFLLDYLPVYREVLRGPRSQTLQRHRTRH